MAATDLLFGSAPVTAKPVALVFGADDVATVSLAATLPGPVLLAHVGTLVDVAVAATLPRLELESRIKPVCDVVVAGTLPALRLAIDLTVLSEDRDVTVEIRLPDPVLSARVGVLVDVEAAATLPDPTLTARTVDICAVYVEAALPRMTLTANAQYRSNTDRPLVGRSNSAWQASNAATTGNELWHAVGTSGRACTEGAWQDARHQQTGWTSILPYRLQRAPIVSQARHAHASRLGAVSRPLSHQDMVRLPQERAGNWSDGTHARRQEDARWQEMFRDRRRGTADVWSDGAPVRMSRRQGIRDALPTALRRSGRFQMAMRPPPGTSRVSGPKPKRPCYDPNPNLRLEEIWFDGTNLVFFCPGTPVVQEPVTTVVVPVRRVYIVINDVSLRRVDGNVALACLELGLTIDVDSWTWGFSASLPGAALSDLEPATDGTPAELEATINGTSYRVLAERLTRDRSFGQSGLKVTGRGKNALLDAPYAPVVTRTNAVDMTAQQLMDDALTINGVGIGWTVDWGIADWLVPAGAWSNQGTYVGALSAIAGAAGAYLLPHPTQPKIHVRARYPSPPWEWDAVTPHVELPSSVTATEGVEWIERPRYNRVFVSGQGQGVLGQVTRAGTAGDLAAPMVTDALITDATVARQRGIAILSDVGRQALVTLRLPVLQATGVIEPGRFVRYLDGATTRLGLVRSTQVAAGFPEVWQTLGVETHVLP